MCLLLHCLMDENTSELRSFLFSAWFATAQALITLAVVLVFIGMLFGILLLMDCFQATIKLSMAYTVTMLSYGVCKYIALGLVYSNV